MSSILFSNLDHKGEFLVYVVDDICDTGQTFEVNGNLPAETKVATLLRRDSKKDLKDFCDL